MKGINDRHKVLRINFSLKKREKERGLKKKKKKKTKANLL